MHINDSNDQSSFVIPQIYPQKLQAPKNIPLSTSPLPKEKYTQDFE